MYQEINGQVPDVSSKSEREADLLGISVNMLAGTFAMVFGALFEGIHCLFYSFVLRCLICDLLQLADEEVMFPCRFAVFLFVRTC